MAAISRPYPTCGGVYKRDKSPPVCIVSVCVCLIEVPLLSVLDGVREQVQN